MTEVQPFTFRLMGTCSICGAIYIGDHCPNCGWWWS